MTAPDRSLGQTRRVRVPIHRSLQSPDANGPRVTLDRDLAERRRGAAGGVEGCGHRVGDQEGGAELLVQLLEPGGEVYGVADRRELLPPRRPHVADHRRAGVEPDPDAERPRTPAEPARPDLRE